MNFSLTLETNDASALRAISTAAAMIEYYSETTGDAPTYALTDALTTMPGSSIPSARRWTVTPPLASICARL